MLKKVLSNVLVFAMVASIFSGCSSQTVKVAETTATAVKEVVNETTGESNSNVKKGVTYMWDTVGKNMKILLILAIMLLM